MSKISTDGGTVSTLTSQFNNSLAPLKFNPKADITYSQSSAVSGLTSCLSSLSGAVSTFKSGATANVGNLTKIHVAIKQAEHNSMK